MPDETDATGQTPPEPQPDSGTPAGAGEGLEGELTDPTLEADAGDDPAAAALRAAREAVASLGGGGEEVASPESAPEPGSAEPEMDQAAAAMLAAARAAVGQATGRAPAAPRPASRSDEAAGARALDLPTFDALAAEVERAPEGIELLSDVDLHVKIELGRTRMLVEDVLRLGEGAVVELDKLAGDPVDVYVNERLVARGEVLVLNDNFCVRVNEVIDPDHERKSSKAG